MAEQQACVRLVAKANVAFGEEVLVIGSTSVLGSWDVAEAAPMTWQEGGCWALEVPLPCGVRVELKVVVKSGAGSYQWHGAGAGGEDNIVLETSLGRTGARGSHLQSGQLPFDLSVQDIDKITQSAPQRGASKDACSTVAVPGKDGPMSEGEMAAILAGQAGAAGRAVTYTTTTVTTTAVTIGADGQESPPVVIGTQQQQNQMPSAGPPQQHSPPGHNGGGGGGGGGDGANYGGGNYGGGAMPIGNSMGMPINNGAGGGNYGNGNGGQHCGAPEIADIDQEALKAAREHNAFVPRMGPVALGWPAGPKKVLVQGSWDSWAQPLALEPAPGGGFRLLMVLPPGEYECKFIVDGTWTTNDQLEVTKCNNRNNIVCASSAALAPMMVSPKVEPGNALAIENEQLMLGN